jgi:chitinase
MEITTPTETANDQNSNNSNNNNNSSNTNSSNNNNDNNKKRVILYHTNWSCYQRNYQVKDIPINLITDINYAFYDLRDCNNNNNNNNNNQSSKVPTSSDPWADYEKRYTDEKEGLLPLDSWNDQPGPGQFYGNFGQFKKLKE